MATLLILAALATVEPTWTGRWQTEVRLEVGAVPGLPPRTATRLRQLAGQPRTAWICLGPGAPADLALSGDTGCSVTGLSAGDGRLAYRRSCPAVTAELVGRSDAGGFLVRGPAEGQPGLSVVVRGRRLAPTC